MTRRTLTLIWGIALAVSTANVFAADHGSTNAPLSEILYTDSLGRTVKASTNDVPKNLQPPADTGLKRQIPSVTKGTSLTGEARQRNEQSREGETGLRFLPGFQPPLMPYLASQNEHGNTAIRHGALMPIFPLEPLVQGTKYWLSEYGLRYSLQQTFTYVSMSDVENGDSSLAFYTFDLETKWAIFNDRASGTAGWISAQVEAQNGLGTGAQTQDAKSNLGSITDPTGIWSSQEGFRVPELAWQQSFRDGEVVAVAGMISQRNYFDGNAYAHSGRSEFINSALIHSMVMPLAQYNFGVNLQFQPHDEWYAMAGASAGQATAGYTPWTDFEWSTWSLIGEFGYAPSNFCGFGPGIYRVQPFVAEKGGPTQGGLCFNLQQQLGAQSPFGWFGRFGFGGSKASSGASAQIASGFVMHAPLMHASLVPKLNNDLLGMGFIWSQPSATTKTVYHDNEYGVETFYTLQLTPTLRLQPDLQVVWDRAFNSDSGPATVFQLQVVLAW